MNKLQAIDYQGERVLTTAQLAESYGTDIQILTNNFNRNKSRYTEGKHYIALEGQDKRSFLNQHQNDLGSKNASVLYLWTEKGAWMHAKSLNTNQAWEAYEMLVDDYYRVKQSIPQLSPAEVLAGVANQLVEQERKLAAIESRMDRTEKQQEDINTILALNPTEWRKKVSNLLNKIAYQLGGQFQAVRNESYELLEDRAKCRLSVRVENIKRRMALEGVSRSKIAGINNLDAIAEDARLTEIYLAIVKEMAVRHRIEVSEL